MILIIDSLHSPFQIRQTTATIQQLVTGLTVEMMLEGEVTAVSDSVITVRGAVFLGVASSIMVYGRGMGGLVLGESYSITHLQVRHVEG